jgi:putative PEP-CTERM system TPR-repeat lipoprotein
MNMTIHTPVRFAAALILFTALFVGGCTETPEGLLASAKGYLEKNDRKAAVIQLKNALQKNPDLAEARFLLGKSLLESGDLLAAEKELRRALELKYPAEQVVPPLARTLVAIGQFEKPAVEFGRLQFASADANAELQSAIGDGQLALGRNDAAQRAYTAALSVKSGHVPALLGLAKVRLGAGELDRALEGVDSLLAKVPKSAEALHLRGNILMAQRKAEQALVAYRAAVEAKPDFLPAHWAQVALLLQSNNVEEAKKELDVAKKLAPVHPQTLYLQAFAAYRARDLDGARQAIQQHLRQAPDNVSGLLLAAAIEYELKSYAQAETHVSKVLQGAPNNMIARRMLITGYLRNGQPEKAREALQSAIQTIGTDPTMLALAGEVYMHNGEPNVASQYFGKAATLDPKDAFKRTALAASHLAAGDTQKGLRELEETAATDPGIRADLALLAAHMRGRDYEKALAVVARVEKKQPTVAMPHNLRGIVLRAKGDSAGARRSFERALQLDPTYFPAVSNLSQMDLADRNPQAARARYEAMLTKSPANPQALLALAQLHAMSGAKPEEVSAFISKAIAARPADGGPRAALIGFYVGVKEPKKAVVAAQEALAAVPNNAEVLDAAGRAYQAAGETNQALSTFSKLSALQPGSPQPLMHMAEVHVATKNYDAALDNLRKALAIRSDLLPAQRAVVSLHVASSRYQEAVEVARQVQKQRPKDSIGYVLEGDILMAQKNVNGAATVYRAALKNVPSTDLATRLHSALATSGGNGADQFAATWLSNHPNDDAFRVHLAQSALATGDDKRAVQLYTKVLERQPNNPLLLNNLAWAAGRLKDPKAVQHAEKANQVAPNEPAIMDTLGVLLTASGETTRAVDILQKASALAPGNGSIRLNLAKALIANGNRDAAKKELNELAKLGDKFPAQVEVSQLMRNL